MTVIAVKGDQSVRKIYFTNSCETHHIEIVRPSLGLRLFVFDAFKAFVAVIKLIEFSSKAYTGSVETIDDMGDKRVAVFIDCVCCQDMA